MILFFLMKGWREKLFCDVQQEGEVTFLFPPFSSLENRRTALVLKFALDYEKNPRYQHWFPRHEKCRYYVRRKAKYKEEFALRDRMRNSPISACDEF